MDITEYTDDLEKILRDAGEEAECLSILHRESFEIYQRRSNLINVPIIILSSIVGFTTALDVGWDKMNILLGCVSILIGVAKSVDSYFSLQARASTHKLVSLQYSQINKAIALELSLSRSHGRMPPNDALQVIKRDLKNLAEISPMIDKKVIAEYSVKFAKYKGHVKLPNILNGLSPIRICDLIEQPPRTPPIHTRDQQEEPTRNEDVVIVPVENEALEM